MAMAGSELTGGRVLLAWASLALADGPLAPPARGEAIPSAVVKPRRLATWFARLSWEVKPLSFFYLVYSDRSPTDPLTDGPRRTGQRERQLIAKLAWSFQR